MSDSFTVKRRDALAASLETLATEVAAPRAGKTRGPALPVSALDLQALATAVRTGDGQQQAQALVASFSADAGSHSLDDRLYWRLRELAESSLSTESSQPALSASVTGAVRSVRDAVEAISRSFVRSTAFATIPTPAGKCVLGIKDLLLLGAIAHADVLLVGRTGSGKSRLASLVMKALFGASGYYVKTVLPSMGPGDFLDLNFKDMTEGKTLQAAKSATAAITSAGLVVNEANRAPGMVQAILIPLLDREFEIEGKPVDVGVRTPGGERYQFRILTVNEGSDYHVEPFDAALRDRTVLQVPMDVFPQSERDVRSMVQGLVAGDSSATSPTPDAVSLAANVFELVEAARAMPLDGAVIPFLTYLVGLGNCVRSPTGFKEGIALVPARDCGGCHHHASFDNQNLCGHVRGPSPRAVVNLLRVSQACALVRAAVSGGPSVVTLDDVEAMAPFVLRGKIGLEARWVENSGPRGQDHLGFAGCEWVAVQAVIQYVRSEFEEFIKSDAFWIADRLAQGSEVSPDAKAHLAWHIENAYGGRGDNWCFNLVRLRDN